MKDRNQIDLPLCGMSNKNTHENFSWSIINYISVPGQTIALFQKQLKYKWITIIGGVIKRDLFQKKYYQHKQNRANHIQLNFQWKTHQRQLIKDQKSKQK